MGFKFATGEDSLIETPASTPPSPFQWKQTTWEGGRANARSFTDQSAFYDSGNMWSLTPESLHPTLQWGHSSGLITGDVYNPQSRNVSWKALHSAERYVASSFVASASYTAVRIFLWIKRVNNPGTLTIQLRSDSGGSPGTVLVTATITTSTVTDVLSLWRRFSLEPAQSLTVGTTYWIVAYGALKDGSTHHWEVGIDAAPATFSKYSAAGSSWSVATYKMYFRSAAAGSFCSMYPFTYMDAQFVCYSSDSSAVASKVYINGDLCKASAATTTTITKTSPLTWTANQWAGCRVLIVQGTGAGCSRLIASNTTTVLTVSAAWDTTPDTTSIFVIYGTDVWTELTGHGLGWVTSTPCVANNIVYFPQGQSVNVRSMYFNASTGAYVYGADGTNRADFMIPAQGNVWKVVKSTNNYQAAYAPFVAQGTALTFTGAIVVGNSDYAVTNLVEHQGAIYVFRRDGVYKILNNYVSVINCGMNKMPTVYNGRAALSFGDILYFGLNFSYERLINGTIDDIGWWRHEGLPDGREGPAAGATNFLSWLFVGVEAWRNPERLILDNPLNMSCVLCWNGAGWSEIFRTMADTSRVRAITMQSGLYTKPRLWVFVENDAFYIDFPDQGVNPLQQSDIYYMHEGYLVTSTIDLNKINLNKIFRDVLTQTKNLSDAACIYIDYQIDNNIGGTTWITANEGKPLRISPIDSLELNLSNANMIRLRLRFETSVSTTPPVLYAVQMNGVYIEPPRYQWNMYAKVTAGAMNDFSPDAALEFLKDAAQNMRLLQVSSNRKSLNGKWVYVSQPTVRRDNTDTQNKRWDGTLSFTLREA